MCRNFPAMERILCRRAALVYASDDEKSPLMDPKNTVLVLPPSDYWVLQAALNVKTEAEAVKYAPALFELNGEYRYAAQKTAQGSYLLIAYSPAEISEKLTCNENWAAVEKITFAQWVFAQESAPVRLKNGNFLVVHEGIVIEMAPSYVHSGDPSSLDDVLRRSRPIKTIPVSGLMAYKITPKTLTLTVVIVLIALGNLITEGFAAYQESERLNEKTQEILESYSLPETSMAREAIIGSLRKKESAQLRLREQCKKISDIPMEVSSPPVPSSSPAATGAASSAEGIVLIPGSKPGEPNRLLVGNALSVPAKAGYADGMEELSYDGKTISLIVNVRDADKAENLRAEIAKRFKKGQITQRDSGLEVRIK